MQGRALLLDNVKFHLIFQHAIKLAYQSLREYTHTHTHTHTHPSKNIFEQQGKKNFRFQGDFISTVA